MSASGPSRQVQSRSNRLSRYFDQVLSGKQVVEDSAGGRRFLEALCDQHDQSSCIEKLIASPSALETLRKCLRFDVSQSFLNDAGAKFIQYLTAPLLKQLCNGQFLQRILAVIVEPPTFWNAILQAHKDRVLTQDTVQCFAWLLLELLSSSGHQVPALRYAAQDVTADGSLLDSPSFEVRTLGQKIKHVLLTTSCEILQDNGPGPVR